MPNIENRIRNAPVSLDMKNSYASSVLQCVARQGTVLSQDDIRHVRRMGECSIDILHYGMLKYRTQN